MPLPVDKSIAGCADCNTGMRLESCKFVPFRTWHKPSVVSLQAQDRCHRIGQTRPVHIYRLVSEATIEENILAKSDQKRQVRSKQPHGLLHAWLMCTQCFLRPAPGSGHLPPTNTWGSHLQAHWAWGDSLTSGALTLLLAARTAGPPGDPVGGLQHRVPVQDQPARPAGGRGRRWAPCYVPTGTGPCAIHYWLLSARVDQRKS
jgi:hypothetical protein